MRALLAALAAATALAVMPLNAAAHGPGFISSRVHFGIGYGFGYPYYRSWGYYPRSYVGVSVWPRTLTRRAGTRQRTVQSGAEQLYVYPGAGQSQQQLSNDRYDCHVWSVGQTNFDPTLGAGSRNQALEYTRAMTACLEARGYVVR